jgi:hypothetical protein
VSVLAGMDESGGNRQETLPVEKDEDDDSSLPTWMRYLPKTPWNSHSVHREFHLEETSSEVQRRKLRVKIPPKLPQSSNPFAVDFKKMDDRKGKKRSIEESDEQCESPLERPSRRRVITPKRNVTKSSINEISMLVSFCKVEKDL